jgi:hypothetical protein
MRHLGMFALFLGCALLVMGCETGRYAQRRTWGYGRGDTVAVMTNHDVIAMSKSGVKENVILNLIKHSEPQFQVSPQDVISLSDSGVTENVINAMIKAQKEPPAQSVRHYAYRPYSYWYADYPWWYWGSAWWDPWYYGTGYYYRPYYSFGYRAPLYLHSGGGFHEHGGGGARMSGGHRR